MTSTYTTQSSHKTGSPSLGKQQQTQCHMADTLKTTLCEFYMSPLNLDKIAPILTRTSPVSLRLLNYFTVKYSNVNSVAYGLNDSVFEVHKSYQEQLKLHHQTYFDPFRRGPKVTLDCKHREPIKTTLAQLCFFKWCIENGVIDYVEKNIAAITEHMKQNSTS